MDPDKGGRKQTLHRNLLLPEESVREDDPEVSPDNQAGQKVPPSTRDNETSKSSSATPKPVLHENGVKGTTSFYLHGTFFKFYLIDSHNASTISLLI
ncbi:hypothetical protein ElyMa_000412300 [Elysia marginata]|uniref:Uncharacterized protein n=1 Tax=Elysia marginata TaxID=1093978 RepID=A0AAV4FKB6_9GAST|nr:hypothetical protein ElyMa_000412300 [Elysia marginata]